MKKLLTVLFIVLALGIITSVILVVFLKDRNELNAKSAEKVINKFIEDNLDTAQEGIASDSNQFAEFLSGEKSILVISVTIRDGQNYALCKVSAPDAASVLREYYEANKDNQITFEQIEEQLLQKIKSAPMVEKEIEILITNTDDIYVPQFTEELIDALYGGMLSFLYNELIPETDIYSENNATEESENPIKNNCRVYAAGADYSIVGINMEMADIIYYYPIVEDMDNVTIQANINGSLKNIAMKSVRSSEGVYGVISDRYEVLIINENLLSVIFPTTLNVNIPTRSVVYILNTNEFVYSVRNLFGTSEDNPHFGDMRKVFEAAGADKTQSDKNFENNFVYFMGEDINNLELHMTYYTDIAYDIKVQLSAVYEYLTEEKAEALDFTR